MVDIQGKGDRNRIWELAEEVQRRKILGIQNGGGQDRSCPYNAEVKIDEVDIFLIRLAFQGFCDLGFFRVGRQQFRINHAVWESIIVLPH